MLGQQLVRFFQTEHVFHVALGYCVLEGGKLGRPHSAIDLGLDINDPDAKFMSRSLDRFACMNHYC